MRSLLIIITLLTLLSHSNSYAQLFQDDFGTAFGSISTTNWPTACRSGGSSFNTSTGSCSGAGDYSYALSGFSNYITTSAITIPSTGYELTFDYSFNYGFSFPTVQIRTGATCGTTLVNTTTLTNTSGTCTPQTINLDAYSGQTIYIRLISNTSSATTYWDNVTVDAGGGGGGSCLLSDDFGTAFASISTTDWPTACRNGGSSFNTSTGPCSGAGDYSYSLSGFGNYITSLALVIPATGYTLDFNYSFNYGFSFPAVEIRTGATCGTTLANSTTLTNTSGVCTPQSINLDAYSGQTIYIRFRANTSSATFYIDDVQVCGGGGSTVDTKWADNFNDNDLTLDYTGNDGDEDCSGCGTWTNTGALTLVPAAGWNGNSNETEAFPDNMSNVYYVQLDRNEYIESPTIDLSSMESVKISFYAKSSSSGTGGGDTWSISDRLKLQIWDGSSWITVRNIYGSATAPEDQITAALPFNYFCFTAYKSSTSPGNYYYTASPNVNAAYFHSDFKFRVLFEGGFSGSPFAWVDDFTFRADADGYSTHIPCGISFWNEAAATSYGQDPGATTLDDSERGVELELDNSINIPPLWASEADDGDVVDQVFGVNESERVVFSVISEQEINFAFPKVHFYAPSMGWQSATLSIDNSYTGPGWKYYSVQYISCDLAGGSIAEPTNDYRYYFSFEYGNEFIPTFYQLNKSGIEMGGGVTSAAEVFTAPDLTSTDACGLALPVEFIAFDAMLEGDVVQLRWSTATEINSDYFVVERSADGQHFTSIGTVDGAGNTTFTTHYTLIDDAPLTGTSYYRLKQVDQDGNYEYTAIKSVQFKATAVQLYPNPTTGLVTLRWQGAIQRVEVYNVLGRLVHTQALHTDHTVAQLSLQQLHEGTYTVRLLNENGYATKRLVIVK